MLLFNLITDEELVKQKNSSSYVERDTICGRVYRSGNNPVRSSSIISKVFLLSTSICCQQVTFQKAVELCAQRKMMLLAKEENDCYGRKLFESTNPYYYDISKLNEDTQIDFEVSSYIVLQIVIFMLLNIKMIKIHILSKSFTKPWSSQLKTAEIVSYKSKTILLCKSPFFI